MQPIHERDDNWSRLLARVGTDRDEAAFERLFNHFSPLIKNFCHSRANAVLSSEAADELVQEVMIKVWQKAPSFDPGKASASTWVFTVMRNCRIDMIRRRNRHVATNDDVEVDDIWDDTTDNQPFVFLQQSRSEMVIRAGLQELPEEQSNVIRKVYMEGKSHSEISTELGLPLGTVKSRVRLALKKLQTTLGR